MTALFTGLLLALCWTSVLEGATVEVRLAWDPPLDPEGTVLEGLAGFILLHGTASGQYTETVDVGMDTDATVQELDPHATYYLAVKSYDPFDVRSEASEEIQWSFDANRNGLPDDWELAHFGWLFDEGTGFDDDFNGDGVTNGEHFVAGTSPTDPTDVPRLTMRMEGGVPHLVVQTIVAEGSNYAGQTRQYGIERCLDLAASRWDPLEGYESFAATGGAVEIPVPTGDRRIAFYRLHIHLE